MAETKSLQKRLARQLAAGGSKNSKGMACGILKKRGDVDKNCKLTKSGKKKQSLGAGGRAKARAAKYSNGKHKAADYKYNAKTNSATLKKK
jgi:hypothetical protein